MLTYITFNQLLDEVMDEFEMYDKNSLIEPSILIPVVQKVSKRLGSRINTRRECVLEVENNHAKLPYNISKINRLYFIGNKTITINTGFPQGLHKDYEEVDLLADNDLNELVEVTPDGFVFRTIYVNNAKPIKYQYKVVSELKLDWKLKDDVTSCFIKGQFLQTHFKEGNIFIDYQAVLEDEEGNLLVPNHPILLEYYKYALKKKILENLYFNGEESATQKLQYVETQYRIAKQEAEHLVNMGEFSEYEQVKDINRKAFFRRYHSKFI